MSPSNESRTRLVLTTLPHFVAVWIAAAFGHPYYAIIGATSTTLSILWHSTGSISKGTLYTANNTATVVWGIADLWFWQASLAMNAGILVLYWLMPSRANWQFVSAAKAVLIAACL